MDGDIEDLWPVYDWLCHAPALPSTLLPPTRCAAAAAMETRANSGFPCVICSDTTQAVTAVICTLPMLAAGRPVWLDLCRHHHGLVYRLATAAYEGLVTFPDVAHGRW